MDHIGITSSMGKAIKSNQESNVHHQFMRFLSDLPRGAVNIALGKQHVVNKDIRIVHLLVYQRLVDQNRVYVSLMSRSLIVATILQVPAYPASR